MRVANELRDHREMYVAIVLLIVAVVLTLSGCGGYEPFDAKGQRYRPWRDDPYSATGADWFDRNIYTQEEADAKSRWKAENPPSDWVDAVRR